MQSISSNNNVSSVQKMKKECGHCKNKGLTFEGHIASECSILAKEICNRCGCEGHLLSYCKLTADDELHLEELYKQYKLRIQFPVLPKSNIGKVTFPKIEITEQLKKSKIVCGMNFEENNSTNLHSVCGMLIIEKKATPAPQNWAKELVATMTPEVIEKERRLQEIANAKSIKIKEEKYAIEKAERLKRRSEWEERETCRQIIKVQTSKFHKEHMIRKYGYRWFVQVQDTPNDSEEACRLRDEDEIRQEKEYYYEEERESKYKKEQQEREAYIEELMERSPEEYRIFEEEEDEYYESIMWNNSCEYFKGVERREEHDRQYKYWFDKQVKAGAILELENGGFKYNLNRLTKDHEYLYA
jgi:hypothetical protein